METIIIRSSIKPNLKRAQMFRATAIAGAGVILLTFSGSFIQAEYLKIWGWLIILIGGGLIVWGMLPYRRLCRKENQPDELRVLGEDFLQYRQLDKPIFTIPTKSIAALKYVEQGYRYGIGIVLKQPVPEKVIVQNRKFNYEKYQQKSLKNANCDLFFPYFSRQGLTRIAFLELFGMFKSQSE